MTIRTIINNAANILGMNDVVRLMQTTTNETQLKSNQNFNVLFRCFNLMIAQVASAARIPAVEYQTSQTNLTGIPLSSAGLTYGLLSEYAFLNGMFNEARVWSVRFEQLLFQEINGRRSITLPRARR